MQSDQEDAKVFYITTPIYYVNDLPHIGHCYTTVAADTLARYYRLRGRTVLFATGTDEHGQKVHQAALAQGVEPQAYVDRIVVPWQQTWQRFHVHYDRFIRTTEPEHMAVVQEVFRRLRDQDDIYPGTYEGWYCIPCEAYLREHELLDGRCPECGRSVETVAQRAYFFRTSKYAAPLLDHIAAHPDFLLPDQRRNEVVSFAQRGLLDNCISRQRSPWDIPVPDDDTQSIYVWFDALINYLTVAGYLQDEDKFARTWPPDVQFMGKDILPRFHATLWPAMLVALGLPLPGTLFAHGWWMAATDNQVGQAKMSKSLGNVLDPIESAQTVADLSGAHPDIAVDAVRYYLLREVPFGLDGTFSTDKVLERFNADLANDLGNLLNRTLPLLARGFDRQTPQPKADTGALAELTDDVRARYEAAFEVCDFRRALEALWELIRAGNKFVDGRQPWNLLREGETRQAAAALYDVLDTARIAALGISPVMPAAAAEIWRQLGLADAGLAMSWDDFRAGALPGGVPVTKPRPIFPRVDLARIRRSRQQEATPLPDPRPTPLISFAEFQKLDLRAARVLSVEPVQGADKLLKLTLDVGEPAPRVVVAGLAPTFGPDDLLGKTVVLVANLEPATIRGVESRGMVLAAGETEPCGLVVLDRDCPPGTKVR